MEITEDKNTIIRLADSLIREDIPRYASELDADLFLEEPTNQPLPDYPDEEAREMAGLKPTMATRGLLEQRKKKLSETAISTSLENTPPRPPVSVAPCLKFAT